jgi:small redox-active disulfide protein 2
MKIQVLGTGCAKCDHLAASAEAAARRLGIEYELEKVIDFMRFADFGVMVTPALVVDGKLKVAGRVPGEAEMERMLNPQPS